MLIGDPKDNADAAGKHRSIRNEMLLARLNVACISSLTQVRCTRGALAHRRPADEGDERAQTCLGDCRREIALGVKAGGVPARGSSLNRCFSG
ncbi:MAG TPA: hypothetical protein DIW77_13490 [Chromatiaceae bacterium]|nr:MAG: hypothetical protein N838_18625 [Thiohalocapsa sp. PB-PSB1]HCS91010.1 hypothetical protein [Chromatiaceae bacterium]